MLLVPQECGFFRRSFKRGSLERNTFSVQPWRKMSKISMFLKLTLVSLWRGCQANEVTTALEYYANLKGRSHTTRFSFHCTTFHCFLHKHAL